MVTNVSAAPAKTPTPSARDKCPVCGMFVSKYPEWIAYTRLRDGSIYFFDGPKDMFSHYFDAGRYTPCKKQGDIVSLAVKDYYSLQMIDARKAFFVTGSDVYGPMGSELIAFAREKDAAGFMHDHKGKRLLRFPEITPAILKSMQ
jgi:nitrous oxide reductase accessory protein NosL